MKSLTLSLLLSALLPMGVFSQKPTDTPTSQMEKLDRGLVVIPYNLFGGHFVSWRLLEPPLVPALFLCLVYYRPFY